MLQKNLTPTKEKELKALREEINKLDYLILLALKKRFKIVKKVAILKKKYDLPIVQKSRWTTIMEDRLKLAVKLKIDQNFISSLMKLIHKESIRIQHTLQNIKGQNKI